MELVEMPSQRFAAIDGVKIGNDVNRPALLRDLLQSPLDQSSATGIERRHQLGCAGKPKRLEDFEGILDTGIDSLHDRAKFRKCIGRIADDPFDLRIDLRIAEGRAERDTKA